MPHGCPTHHAPDADAGPARGEASSSVLDAPSLTRDIARGNPQALGVLFEHRFDFCLLAASRLTRRDEAFCLDVVQDVFLRVARSLPSLEGQAQLDAWLRRTVHSICLDHLRAERRRARRERTHATERNPGGTDAELDARIDWLRERLEQLDETDRHLLDLRFGRTASIRQTALAAGRTFEAAHARLKRILATLRTREDHHDA